jgi:hypothetical protein
MSVTERDEKTLVLLTTVYLNQTVASERAGHNIKTDTCTGNADHCHIFVCRKWIYLYLYIKYSV